MQCLKSSILKHVRLQASLRTCLFTRNASVLNKFTRQLCTAPACGCDQIMDRMIGLVNKFHKTDSIKVTETTNFQKDLSLDSLDRVELVMAFEEEFSIEIPEEVADKLTCCADVAKFISDETKQT